MEQVLTRNLNFGFDIPTLLYNGEMEHGNFF